LHGAAGKVGALESGEVFLELRIFACAVLEASEIRREFGRGFFRQMVNHPLSLALHSDEATCSQVGEVLGNFHLWFAEHRLKVTDAEWALREQIKQTQTRDVTQAFVNADELHESDESFSHRNIPQGEYIYDTGT
jgi:hypothetical protein